jgi:hypothetical protein
VGSETPKFDYQGEGADAQIKNSRLKFQNYRLGENPRGLDHTLGFHKIVYLSTIISSENHIIQLSPRIGGTNLQA